MSMRALLLAVRNDLRSRLSLSHVACEITDDGRPLPVCAGPFFFAVVPGEWRRGLDPDYGLDEYFGVDVWVTAWAAKVPVDRLGPNLLAGPTGQSLYEKAELVRATLHKDPHSYAVLNAANVLIGAGENGFVEPLLFQSAGRAEVKGPDWFYSSDKAGRAAVGLAINLRFGEARRIQVNSEQS